MSLIISSTSENASQRPIYSSLPLDYTNEEIRLLIIEPGQGPEPIRLQIFKAKLDDNPVFNALSYAWSKGGVDVQVQVGGEVITVSETLHRALVHLREPGTASVLWVDAICINQRSIKEKNHQVPLMGKIYSSAQEVIIWLGDTTDEMNPAIEFLAYLETTITSSKPTPEDLRQVEDYLDSQIESQDALDAALIALFQRPWFSRTWILQEAALPSKEPRFLCGPHGISWASLAHIHSFLWSWFRERHGERCSIHDPRSRSEELHLSFDLWTFGEIDNLRNIIQFMRPCGPPLEYLTSITRGSLASDPRDRVYGLLGMSCQGHGIQVEVDYAKPIAEVFRDAMASMLGRRNGMSSLALKEKELLNCRCSEAECVCDFNPSSVSGASWVPNFGTTFRTLSQTSFSTPISSFRADAGVVVPGLTIRGGSLIAHGLLVDVVGHTKAVRTKGKGIEWTPLLPLMEFLQKHAKVASHDEEKHRDLNGCPSCLPRHSHTESMMSLLNQFYQVGPKSEPKNPDERPGKDHSRLEAIASLLPQNLQQSVLEFDKCGLYKTPTGLQSSFWDAAWRTLVADNNLISTKSQPELIDGDHIRFALHWERLTEELNNSAIQDGEPPLKTTQPSDQPQPPQESNLPLDALYNLHRSSTVSNLFSKIYHSNTHTLLFRGVFVTRNGWMGLGPRVVQPGDIVVVLFGGKVPYILRPVEDHYVFIGECYLHGIMDGEFVSQFLGATMAGEEEGDWAWRPDICASPTRFEIH